MKTLFTTNGCRTLCLALLCALVMSGCKHSQGSAQDDPGGNGGSDVCQGTSTPCPDNGGGGDDGGKNKVCKGSACPGAWTRKLDERAIGGLVALLDNDQQRMASVSGPLRVVLASSVFSHELMLILRENVSPWDGNAADEEAYIWLFERFFTNDGNLRSARELREIPNAIRVNFGN